MQVLGLEPLDGVWLSSEEFQERCFARLLTIKGEPGGAKEMIRLSTPRAKKLSEELMPVAAYTRFHANDDFDIRWLGGNQGYDAEIRSKAPRLPQYLEVTMALPDNEHLVRAFHADHGYSWRAAGTHRDPITKKIDSVATAGEATADLREVESAVRVAVLKKLAKAYPAATSLIVQLRLERCLLREEFMGLTQLLRERPVDPEMRFREIVLVEPFEYTAAAL